MEINIEKRGNITFVNINGALYIATMPYFESMWAEIMKDEPEVIAINCAAVELIDSTALGILAHYLKILDSQNRKLIFYDLSDAVINIFRLTKLDKFFNVMTKEELDLMYK